MLFKALFSAAALVASVAAQGRTIQILAVQDLSLEDTFVFKPREIRANMGDVLEFHFAPTGFLPSNHSVAQGTFEKGCEPMPSGFWSGYVAAPAGTPLGEAEQVFRVTVATTQPMVFYCATGQHCTRGMYGVVNPNDQQNLASYKATIPKNGAAVAPTRIQGGQLVANPGAIPQNQLVSGVSAVKASVAGLAGAAAVAVLMI